jgi:hypothetical protein
MLILICFTACLVYTQTPPPNKVTPVPYTSDEFPDWARQIRRTEIITIGSLPFTTLGISTIYGLFRYVKNNFNPEYIPNPLAKSSSAANLDEEEQKNIVISAVTVSVVVGLIDLVITLIKNAREKKSNERAVVPDTVTIQKQIIQQEMED